MSITFQPMLTKIFGALTIVLLFSGCGSVDTDAIDNLNNGKILKLGHAGLGFESVINPFNPYPPNGYTALKKAMDYGADGVEVDVQMTKDSVLVLFHDLELGETTDMVGCIQEKTWSEIQEGHYELGFFYDLFQSDKIMRLDSLLSWFQTFEEFPYIHFDMRIYNTCNEAKPYAYNGNMAPVLLSLLQEYKVPTNKVLIISTTVEFLEYLQELQSPYPLSYEETGDFDKGLKAVLDLGITSMTIKPKLITAKDVARAHKQNIEIVTFGGKSRSGTAGLVELNPDVIHTNNIRALVDLLGE